MYNYDGPTHVNRADPPCCGGAQYTFIYYIHIMHLRIEIIIIITIINII